MSKKKEKAATREWPLGYESMHVAIDINVDELFTSVLDWMGYEDVINILALRADNAGDESTAGKLRRLRDELAADSEAEDTS